MSLIANIWDQVLDFFNHDPFNLCIWGSALVIMGLFWFLCGVFMIIDLTGKPAWILKYKTQPLENSPLDSGKAWSAAKQALINQLLVGLPLSIACFPLIQWLGFTWKTEDLPTLGCFLRDILGAVVIEEVCFYYSHRLFHWPPLYKRFHKKHHEWTAPVGIISLYAHPLEHALSNHTPVMLGPMLMRMHVSTSWVWYLLALFTTILTHSGYHLPFMPSPEFHDFHHLKFNYNYGTVGFLDWLHGTDKLFKEAVHSKRHRFLFGFQSMRQQFPDNKQSSSISNGVAKIDLKKEK